VTRPIWAAEAPLLADLTAAVPLDLRDACTLANACAYQWLGYRNSCILTSHALAAFLRLRGHDASLVRVELHPFPQCRCTPDTLAALNVRYNSNLRWESCHGRNCDAYVLGWDGDGSRRRAASPGKWAGHLAVTSEGCLLDPTADQVNKSFEVLRPVAVPLPEGWDEGKGIRFTDGSRTFVRYERYHRQAGWKSAGDARPSHWMPVVHRMVGRFLKEQP
jgi:hypothetical protein